MSEFLIWQVSHWHKEMKLNIAESGIIESISSTWSKFISDIFLYTFWCL